MSDSDSSAGVQVNIITVKDFLHMGLRLAGFSRKRIRRCAEATNCQRFRDRHGPTPKSVAQVWEEMQTTTIAEAFVAAECRDPRHCLMALHFVKRCDTESEREATHDEPTMKMRDWRWHFLERIQALKAAKIVWPEPLGDAIWVISIDGVDCWTLEHNHEEHAQDPARHSHKCNKAALRCELGLSLNSNKLIWMNGPHEAGKFSDRKIFRKKLPKKLKALKKMGIADGGHTSCPQQLSMPNAHDSKSVRKFKSRALKRQERFNNKTKCCQVLSSRFRHGERRFPVCFEAVCVLCQHDIENGSPLFNVHAGDLQN